MVAACLFFLTCRKDNAGVAPQFIYLSAAAQRSTLGYHLKSSTVPGLDASWMNELSSEKRSKGADPNGFYPWFTKVDGRVLTPLFIFHSSSLGSILFQQEHFFIGDCMIKPRFFAHSLVFSILRVLFICIGAHAYLGLWPSILSVDSAIVPVDHTGTFPSCNNRQAFAAIALLLLVYVIKLEAFA